MTAPARPRTLAERQALWRERRDLREAAYREALERVRDGCPTIREAREVAAEALDPGVRRTG